MKQWDKAAVYQLLTERGIWHEITEHPAVYNMEEMAAVDLPYPEADGKNLFVRDDKKRQYYLITVRGDKRVDLKAFRQANHTRPLSFASAEDLWDKLGLTPRVCHPSGAAGKGRGAGGTLPGSGVPGPAGAHRGPPQRQHRHPLAADGGPHRPAAGPRHRRPRGAGVRGPWSWPWPCWARSGPSPGLWRRSATSWRTGCRGTPTTSSPSPWPSPGRARPRPLDPFPPPKGGPAGAALFAWCLENFLFPLKKKIKLHFTSICRTNLHNGGTLGPVSEKRKPEGGKDPCLHRPSRLPRSLRNS